jgi:oligopeptide/dipeptide ABC transporter ATP-binding protein
LTDHLLDVEGLEVTYGADRGVGALGRRREVVRAVDSVGFTLDRGETLALVGESGSGKTTTAHAVLRLVEASAGTIRFKGSDLGGMRGRRLRALRKQMQLIYQDPYESLDPRDPVERIVEEPLLVHRTLPSRQARRERVRQALEQVGLSPAELFLRRRPHELSGGQRQRVSIAAALVLEPDLLIADEPVSMLDVSVRAGILDLLDQLRSSGLGILMITHDLSTAAHYADRIAVMYLGRIVEIGPSRRIVTNPQHPYTRALLSVVPQPHRNGAKRAILSGEIPNAAAIPTGCRFHPRCPIATAECESLAPSLEPLTRSEPAHQVACLNIERSPTEGRRADRVERG